MCNVKPECVDCGVQSVTRGMQSVDGVLSVEYQYVPHKAVAEVSSIGNL